MNLIAVQFDIAWEDCAANLAKVRRMLAAAPPGRGSLVAVPEMFHAGFSMDVDAIADERGEAEAFVGEMARTYGVYVVGGIVNKEPLAAADCRPQVLGRNARATGRNEAIVAGPGGNIIARYGKIHPFGVEAKHYRAGKEIVTFRCFDATADALTAAPFVCYDLRFPEIFRAGMLRGAQLFIVIASWPSARVEHWTTLLRARAIENQAYVLGVNRCGSDPNFPYPGKSIIVDFRGNVLAEAGSGEEIISAEVDLAALQTYRAELPFLRDAREAFLPQMNTDGHR